MSQSPNLQTLDKSLQLLTPESISKITHNLSIKNKTELDEQSLFIFTPPSQDLKAFANNSEIKSISQLNNKKFNNFNRTKTAEISRPLFLKSKIIDSKNKETLIEPLNNEKLEILDLSFRKLMKFPINISTITLQEINLSYNELIDFPTELLTISNLRYLKLDFNKITTLPSEIHKLSNLEFLSISNNKITSLPSTLKNLIHLKCLFIGKNFIKTISYEITSLDSLEVLYIYGNLFETFPVSFKNLKNLNEFAFDWLGYTNPPIDTILKKPAHLHVFSKIFQLCDEMSNLRLSSISFINFLQSLSLDPIDFTKPDIKTRNLMHIAAMKDELSVLINLGKEYPELINQIDRENQTPLTLSLLENKSRSVQCLIGLGADPSKGGGHLGSSLHLAVFKLDASITEIFLKGKCDPNAVDLDLNTPLHLYGVDINAKNKDQWTAVHLAIKRSQTKAVIWAIEFNEKKKKELKNECKEKFLFNFGKKGGFNLLTPMHLAIHNGNLQIIELLGENNVDLFAENLNYQIPRDFSYNSLLLVKLTRKLERKWIFKNIICKNNKLSQPICELNFGIMKSKLEPKIIRNNISKEIDLKITTDKLVLPNFLCNISEESINDPERTFHFSDEEDLEVLEEFSSKNINMKSNEFLNRNIIKGTINISDLNAKQAKKHSKILNKDVLFQKIFFLSNENNNFFSIKNDSLLTSSQNLDIKSFITEIQKFVNVISIEDCSLSEKLRHIWYLKVFYYKINGIFNRYYSEFLPWYVFILNEFYVLKRKNFKEIELITNLFMEIFDLLINKCLNEENNTLIQDSLNKAVNNMYLIENDCILLELMRIFQEFNLKKSRKFIKKVLLRKNKAKILQFETIQLLSNFLLNSEEIKRDSSLPLRKNTDKIIINKIDNSIEKKLKMNKSEFILNNNLQTIENNKINKNKLLTKKSIEEEIPIKMLNLKSLHEKPTSKFDSKNPFNSKIPKKLFVENLNEDDANDEMELHLEKYFQSKFFCSPFNVEEIKIKKDLRK